jgi:hypothetical protein
MAASRFRPPMQAKEILATKKPDPEIPWHEPARYTMPTGRFTPARRSKKGLRNLPRKAQVAIRKALRKEATP